MTENPNRRPQLAPELQARLDQVLAASFTAQTSGDITTAASLVCEAWDLLPDDTFAWDFYPQVIARGVVEDGAALGMCDQLPIWIERMYTAYDDLQRENLATLHAEGQGWLGCGRDAEARLAFQRAFDLYGKAGFPGEWGRYLDWLNGAPLEPEPVDEPPSMPPEELERQIDEFAEAGNALFDDDDDLQGAIEMWRRGLAILPASERYSEAAMWFHASIGMAQRLAGETANELESFELAYRSGDGVVNPLVLAGVGMALYDNGQPDDAVDYLLRAYMMSGDELFEDEDAKYLELLKSRGLI